jgi:pimeloyl-ACP methyl ester carboxylesterase
MAANPAPTKARNVVLVHGLFADGSSWSEVIPRLQAVGLNVTSVQNPLTTLPEAVASAQRVLARQDGPTVLVGHSFSGMIVTEVGVHPNVSALVYVAARAPDAGEDYTALAKTFPTPPASAGIVFDGDEGRLSEAAFLRDFAGDIPEPKAKVLYAVPEPFGAGEAVLNAASFARFAPHRGAVALAAADTKADTLLVAAGTSYRHHIHDGTERAAIHVVCVLERALP